MEWEYDLNRTRPITLLECVRKAVVKVISKRLSNIIAKHKVLKGTNHAEIPNSNIMIPIKIIKSIIEEAKCKNKEFWILFQDLSKAYNRVNIYMLDKAMSRIRILIHRRNF